MTSRDDSGWSDVDAERLGQLGGDDFEQFCFDLIQFEAYDRHDGPQLDGPVGMAVPDGGRDALLTLSRTPRTSKLDYQTRHHLGPLTEDPLAGRARTRVAYSCKTGKWFDDALDDAANGAERAVEVLLEGGYFKLLINVPGKLDAPVSPRKKGLAAPGLRREHIAAEFLARLRANRADAEDPISRIEIIDANALALFLRARRPEGLDRWAKELGLRPLLADLVDWRADQMRRGEPRFSPDAARHDLQARLVAFARMDAPDAHDRVAWLVGPPGVGKTRVAYIALESEPDVAQRVRVALGPEQAMGALDSGRILTQYPSILLVVDDCPPQEAQELAHRFVIAAASRRSAHMLILTPASEEIVAKYDLAHKWSLPALDSAATERLVASEIGSDADSEVVRELSRLSEGFPWFALLLARGVHEYHRAPHDINEAVQWTLASRGEKTPELALQSLRKRRARCLLAATLTRRVDWGQLAREQRDDVARAVGLTWEEVQEGALECWERGILRRNLGWHYKYVTPAILEKLVIAWLLGPDGTDPGGRDLARYGQAYLTDFFETLARLDLPIDVATDIARVAFRDLASASSDWPALRAAGLLGPRLLFMARHLPRETAHELRRRIDETSVEVLRSRVEERRGLVFALEHMAFESEVLVDAEAALFRLALAENESYANNATATWADIFVRWGSDASLGPGERFDLLERRLDECDPLARRIALAGIKAVLSIGPHRLVRNLGDGALPPPTATEAREVRQRAWSLLAARFADAEASVASHAKTLAVEELRGAVRMGLGAEAMAAIAEQLSVFSSTERVRLREKLAELRTYDRKWLDPESEYLTHLEDLLTPRTYRDRLRQQVGAWGPAPLRKDQDARDDDVARDGLVGDPPELLGELDWLVSDDARRAHVFAYAMGRCDERSVLLAGLRARARAWQTAWRSRVVFARYLGGFREAGRTAEADAVLHEMQASPAEAPVMALAIVEVGATPERIEWIASALRAGKLDAAVIMEFARRPGWLNDAREGEVGSLVRALVDGASIEQPAAALELLGVRIQVDPARAVTFRLELIRALERLAPESTQGMTDYYWQLGAEALIDLGETDRVAALAVMALARARGSYDHAWNTLHKVAARDAGAVWRSVAVALDRGDDQAVRVQAAFRFHRASFWWPSVDVLAWVGNDPARGKAVTSLVAPFGVELDPILRSLIRRFGPKSSVAREISSRVHSTNGMVHSLAEHAAERLAQARVWQRDADPNIRAFAQDLVTSLEQISEHYAAQEEDRRRRFGT